MIVGIVGSRNAADDTYGKILAELPEDVTEIVSGGAKGVDEMARRIALEKGLPLTEFLPDYATFGRRAATVRNGQIVNRAELVLAFWDGKSRGTMDSINKTLKAGKPLRVIPIDKA